MRKLHLNDFDGFERYLFTKKERTLPDQEKWKRFYDVKHDEFRPPYTGDFENCPLEKFQLNHYAYWMVISAFNLDYKPKIHTMKLIAKCYACQAKLFYTSNVHCESSCPIRNWGPNGEKRCLRCDSYYNKWLLAPSSDMAKKIAYLKWSDERSND